MSALAVEISSAPAVVQATFEAHRAHMEALETSAEATMLAEAYLAAKVVPVASRVDALHVALASIAGADAVVNQRSVSADFRTRAAPSDSRCTHPDFTLGLYGRACRDNDCTDGSPVFRTTPSTRAAPSTPPESTTGSDSPKVDLAFAVT